MAKKKLKKKAIKRKAVKRKAIKKKSPKSKILKRKPSKKAPPKKKKLQAAKKLKANVIGIVTHYFPKVRAAVVKLKVPLSVGETVKIKGHTTDFKQTINSMQIDHVPVNIAKKGQEIGLLVNSRVRQHDMVCKA